MRTKKNVLNSMLLLLALLFSFMGFTQDKESYGMAEIAYIKAKIGMETNFIKAVKKHNTTYHKAEPYKAYLDYIMSGKESGWFVWSMGPCTFTDLDNAPGEGAHNNHWDTKVAPLVAEYGKQEFWRYNKKLSYSSGKKENKFANIWFIDVKRGDYHRFKVLVSKIKDAYEKRGTKSIAVYNNQFNDNEGRDVAIVWELKNLAEMDDDSESIKKEFEEINGEGSWENMLDNWEDITVDINSQLWEINIAK